MARSETPRGRPDADHLPLFSIIVPVLNDEETISRTIESILAQRIGSIEIIVVDGKSSDGTLAALQPFARALAHLVSEPDNGIYDAINKGLALCTGQIVAILNGDDYYTDDEVLSLYAAEFADSDVDIVFSDVVYFSAHNTSRTIRRYSSKRFRPEKLAWGWMPPHPTVFVRKGVYDRVGRYRTDYAIAADYEFLVRALLVHRLPYRRLDCVAVRMQYGGLSTSGPCATFTLNKEIIRACRENGIRTSWLRVLSKYPQKALELIIHKA